MTKIKVDVEGVERKVFSDIKPGVWEMEIIEAEYRPDIPDIKINLEATTNNDDCVGARQFTYVNLGENSKWKLAEFLDALGMPEKGDLDTDKLIGRRLKVKINSDSYKDDEGNTKQSTRVGRFSPIEATASGDAAVDPDAGAAEPEAEAEGGEEEVVINAVEFDGVEFGDQPEYYEDWSDDEVKEECQRPEVTVEGRYSRAKGVAALAAFAAGLLGDDEEGGEAAAEEGDDYDDEAEWPTEALAEEIGKRSLEIAGRKTREKFIAALRADNSDPFTS